MASFNKIILLGNVTRDLELRYTPSNSAVVSFGLAVNRKWKDAQGQDREEVLFIDCTAFGKGAETLNQFVAKGDLLFIDGRLKLDVWDDKNGGGKRSKHGVIIDNFQLMPKREGGAQEQAAPARQPPAMKSRKPMAQVPADPIDETGDQFVEEGLPF